MQLPEFCECQHPLVQALQGQEDEKLLRQWQAEPAQGRAFVALFCRYALVVYALVSHAAPTAVQVDYLFATTWRYLYQQLREFSPPEGMTSLQSWLVDRTGDWLTRVKLPAPECIHYRLPAAPPPLWCYLEEALQKLVMPLRSVMVLKTIGNWSEEQIAQELALTPEQVAALLPIGQRELMMHLPEDIRSIYLAKEPVDG
ncbi:sigma-70 family RNA polymerase sigma factor [Gloeomargarita sp.]